MNEVFMHYTALSQIITGEEDIQRYGSWEKAEAIEAQRAEEKRNKLFDVITLPGRAPTPFERNWKSDEALLGLRSVQFVYNVVNFVDSSGLRMSAHHQYSD